MAVASVGGEVDLHKFNIGTAVVDGGDRDIGGKIPQVAHHAYLKLVFCLLLPEVETYFHIVDIGIEVWHGKDTPLVEDKAVVAAVGIVGVVVYHGLVLVGYGDILTGESPARRPDTRLGSSGGGVVVEVIKEGQALDGAVVVDDEV